MWRMLPPTSCSGPAAVRGVGDGSCSCAQRSAISSGSPVAHRSRPSVRSCCKAASTRGSTAAPMHRHAWQADDCDQVASAEHIDAAVAVSGPVPALCHFQPVHRGGRDGWVMWAVMLAAAERVLHVGEACRRRARAAGRDVVAPVPGMHMLSVSSPLTAAGAGAAHAPRDDDISQQRIHSVVRACAADPIVTCAGASRC